jgi:hypothetical protein
VTNDQSSQDFVPKCLRTSFFSLVYLSTTGKIQKLCQCPVRKLAMPHQYLLASGTFQGRGTLNWFKRRRKLPRRIQESPCHILNSSCSHSHNTVGQHEGCRSSERRGENSLKFEVARLRSSPNHRHSEESRIALGAFGHGHCIVAAIERLMRQTLSAICADGWRGGQAKASCHEDEFARDGQFAGAESCRFRDPFGRSGRVKCQLTRK